MEVKIIANSNGHDEKFGSIVSVVDSGMDGYYRTVWAGRYISKNDCVIIEDSNYPYNESPVKRPIDEIPKHLLEDGSPDMELNGVVEGILNEIAGGTMEAKLSITQKEIQKYCQEIAEFLIDKNRNYGDSAISPKRVFSKCNNIEQINVRIDDKLSRIESNQGGDMEDAEKDLIGYLILKKVAQRLQDG